MLTAKTPIDEGSMGRLCAIWLGADVDATVLALADRCGGNPFLLKQLLVTLRADRQVTATYLGVGG